MDPVREFEELLDRLFTLNIRLARDLKRKQELEKSLQTAEHTPTTEELAKLEAARSRGTVGPADVPSFFETPLSLNVRYNAEEELRRVTTNWKSTLDQWGKIKGNLAAALPGFIGQAKRVDPDDSKAAEVIGLVDKIDPLPGMAADSISDLRLIARNVRCALDAQAIPAHEDAVASKPDTSKWLRVKRAAEVSGLSEASISGACRDNRLEYRGNRGNRRINPKSLAKLKKQAALQAAAGIRPGKRGANAKPDVSSGECPQCGTVVTLRRGVGKCPKCNNSSGFTQLAPSCATPKRRQH